MKSDIANEFANFIIEESKRLEVVAKMHAVRYAETDDAAAKALFDKYMFASQEVRKLHITACQTLHAIESKYEISE